MLERQCDECGETFQAKTKRKRFCKDACRVKANRRPSKKGAAESNAGSEPDEAPTPPAHEPGQLLARVIADLSAAAVLDTIPGRAALALAYRVESPMETGSAAAALTKELSRLVAEAKELAPKAQDGIDDLDDRVGRKLRAVK